MTLGSTILLGSKPGGTCDLIACIVGFHSLTGATINHVATLKREEREEIGRIPPTVRRWRRINFALVGGDRGLAIDGVDWVCIERCVTLVLQAGFARGMLDEHACCLSQHTVLLPAHCAPTSTLRSCQLTSLPPAHRAPSSTPRSYQYTARLPASGG
jgi:hypothetical protein